MDGFEFTMHGWVQSYGSRYVRPPIIHDTIKRTAPMTIREFEVAQSLTERPVKGMLTGPITIMNWSFGRADVPRAVSVLEMGVAIRGEVADLEAAGCTAIQVWCSTSFGRCMSVGASVWSPAVSAVQLLFTDLLRLHQKLHVVKASFVLAVSIGVYHPHSWLHASM